MCSHVRRRGAVLGSRGAASPPGGQDQVRPAAGAGRGVLLSRDDVQRADPRRHDRSCRRRCAGRGPAGAVGRGHRGERGPRDPGPLLRRRRRPLVRRELREHGRCHAVRGLRDLRAPRAAHVPHRFAACVRGRRRRLRRDHRGGVVRGHRVRSAARPLLQDVRKWSAHPVVRAVRPRADDSRDGRRAPTGRRFRGVRADRGSDHVSAAGQPPDHADQSSGDRRVRRRPDAGGTQPARPGRPARARSTARAGSARAARAGRRVR